MKGALDVQYAVQRERRLDFRYRLKRRSREVLKSISRWARSPGRVLDLGTADGRMAHLLKRAHPNAVFVGLDCSLDLLRYGAERFKGIRYVCADIQRLCLREGPLFDVVIATAVLEHLRMPEATIKECAGLLNEEGILVITVPNKYWEIAAARLGLIPGAHQSHLILSDIVAMCQRAGLEILEQRGFMLSPIGLWGEERIERRLARIHWDAYLPNQLVVAQEGASRDMKRFS